MDFQNHEDFRRRMAKRNFVFDKSSKNFSEHPEYNRYFITSMENYFSDILAMQGYVFLNDILKKFDIKPTIGGQLAGWKKGPIKISVIHVEDDKYFLQFNHEGFILDALGD